MRKTIMIIFLAGVLFGCNKKAKGLNLEILNDNLVTTGVKDSNHLSGNGNVLRYKLTNNDDKAYYFNLNVHSSLLKNVLHVKPKYLPLNTCGVVFETNGDSLEIGSRIGFRPYPCISEISSNKQKLAESLGYNMNVERMENSNFVIHPNETLYFEELIFLPGDEYLQFNIVPISNDNEDVDVSIFMYSDSTKVKTAISNADYLRIRENGYTTYHGLIKSKNKIHLKQKK